MGSSFNDVQDERILPNPLTLNLLKDGQPPPYRRVRRMVFLQVAVQVRLCRARSL